MPPPVTIPSTFFPTLNGLPSTLPLSPSIRETVPPSWLFTHTTPFSSTAMPSGPLPTSMVATALACDCAGAAVAAGVAVAVAVGRAAAVAPLSAAPSPPPSTPLAASTAAARPAAKTVPSVPPTSLRWRLGQGSGSASPTGEAAADQLAVALGPGQRLVVLDGRVILGRLAVGTARRRARRGGRDDRRGGGGERRERRGCSCRSRRRVAHRGQRSARELAGGGVAL